MWSTANAVTNAGMLLLVERRVLGIWDASRKAAAALWLRLAASFLMISNTASRSSSVSVGYLETTELVVSG